MRYNPLLKHFKIFVSGSEMRCPSIMLDGQGKWFPNISNSKHKCIDIFRAIRWLGFLAGM